MTLILDFVVIFLLDISYEIRFERFIYAIAERITNNTQSESRKLLNARFTRDQKATWT